MKVIANTTILSNFAAVGRLEVLRDLLGEVYITTEVYTEIQDGLAEGCNFYAGIETFLHPLAADGWLKLTSMEDDDERRLFSSLPTVYSPCPSSRPGC